MHTNRQNLFSLIVVLTTVLNLSACSFLPTEYKIDIQQGNIITQDMASQLKPGLTRNQVKYLLGTPLLTDIFHADRWDYLYSMNYRNSQGVDEQKIISVFFDKDGKLIRVGGHVTPVPTQNLPPNSSIAREVEVDRLKK